MSNTTSSHSSGPSSAKDSAGRSAEEKLSAEDLARVEKYLSSAIHSVERKPFRPYMMMGLLIAVVLGLGSLSIIISWFVL